MNADIERLIVLQAIDIEQQRLEAELKEAPRRIATAESAVHGAEQALAAAQQGLTREEALRRSQELDAEGHRSKIARLRRQMDSATSAAQIAALEHEIGFAESAIRKLEDEEIASMERSEELEAHRAASAAQLERARSGCAAERERSAAAIERAHSRITALETERASLRGSVGERPLAIYDRVRKSRGTGLSEALEHKCSACQMMVRPQRWNDLTGRDHEDEIFTCETCGRILFWDPRRDAPRSWDAGERLAAITPATESAG
jgi:hypothetical protein